jgi:hypothetical protein
MLIQHMGIIQKMIVHMIVMVRLTRTRRLTAAIAQVAVVQSRPGKEAKYLKKNSWWFFVFIPPVSRFLTGGSKGFDYGI